MNNKTKRVTENKTRKTRKKKSMKAKPEVGKESKYCKRFETKKRKEKQKRKKQRDDKQLALTSFLNPFWSLERSSNTDRRLTVSSNNKIILTCRSARDRKETNTSILGCRHTRPLCTYTLSEQFIR